jgi:rhamnosyl/mannosyltransferase
LLFIGRHRYYKGIDHLLASLQQVENAELWIGGDGPMRLEWEQLAAGLGLAERVRFLGDITPEALPGVYSSADLFVLPSTLRAEAFGIVLLEAMAAGLPCVTTELGTGTSYIVQDGKTGRVVRPGDPAALAQVLQELISEPAEMQRMGAAGRERVFNEFTLEHMAERVESIYRTIMDERAGGSNPQVL